MDILKKINDSGGNNKGPAIITGPSFLWQFSLLTKRLLKDKNYKTYAYTDIVRHLTKICHLYTFFMYVNSMLKNVRERPQTAFFKTFPLQKSLSLELMPFL
ncbi:hypothetical protein SAMN04488122_6016 [Chitinophaga arvensicola]|uniref:Uncharacterized protein n=1 Tax=Chitinophaga arvensicola TaxID=29529 RepID=A0A1I0SBR9_9BACT|nr:hypothetical protein SAMN04488122_6016 [Chitinophaga arvensicola]